MRYLARTLALALTLSLAAPVVAAEVIEEIPPGPAAEAQAVGDIAHVASIPYGSGSDLEFGTFRVQKLSDGVTGDPICAVHDPDTGECLEYEMEDRDFAFVGRLSQAGHVIDITNPREPAIVASLPCRMNQNDIQIQGNLLFQSADNTTGSCTRPEGGGNVSATVGISDISNPREPRFLGRLLESRGAHNSTVHPTEPLLYISNSDQVGDGRVHIFDFSDPTNPVRVQDWVYLPVFSPHDITFNADGTRAYLAARTFTHIANTEDPRNPVMIASIPHHGYLSHQADPTPDGKLLFVSEELGGGGFTLPSPGGPVMVWDIRDETKPVEIGAWGNDDVGVNGVSTSHVFRINPEGTSMAIAWYRDGVHVVDISSYRGVNAAGLGQTSTAGPRLVGSMRLENANTWSAKMWQERHPGYVFANDINRGFDVFQVGSMGEDFVGFGAIQGTGGAQTYEARTGVTLNEFLEECEPSPFAQGVDAWVAQIPARYAGGAHDLLVTPQFAAVGDPDILFYDASCTYVGEAATIAESTERGPIPEGAAFAVVANWWNGPYRFRLSVEQTPA